MKRYKNKINPRIFKAVSKIFFGLFVFFSDSLSPFDSMFTNKNTNVTTVLFCSLARIKNYLYISCICHQWRRKAHKPDNITIEYTEDNTSSNIIYCHRNHADLTPISDSTIKYYVVWMSLNHRWNECDGFLDKRCLKKFLSKICLDFKYCLFWAFSTSFLVNRRFEWINKAVTLFRPAYLGVSVPKITLAKK